jgi:hypothetical protein
MNYAKPEVAVLGHAVRVIEDRQGKNGFTYLDPITKVVDVPPAYDLDE